MTTAWPFGADADRNDPLTQLRIAVASPWAQWNYIVTFDRESAARPTDAEATMLASFLRQYIDHWYNATFKAKLAQRALDVDGGANGITFRKYADGDWGYRRRTWTSGPMFVPEHPRFADRSLGPLTLPQLMDHIYSDHDGQQRPEWQAWKAKHPEVFA